MLKKYLDKISLAKVAIYCDKFEKLSLLFPSAFYLLPSHILHTPISNS